MAYYVPLGPRGLILRVGTAIIGVFGAWIYRRACRQRARSPLPVPEPIYLRIDS